MDTILQNQAGAWIALGFLLLAIEALAFGFASGVLLFGSLGAILTGALIWFSILPNQFIPAVACFAVSTTLITALLWSPLKKLQSGAELGNDRSSDLIGHTFRVSSDITASSPGQQKYSGIQWRVELSNELSAGTTIAAGTTVKVTAVSVGVFFVAPENSTA